MERPTTGVVGQVVLIAGGVKRGSPSYLSTSEQGPASLGLVAVSHNYGLLVHVPCSASGGDATVAVPTPCQPQVE
jgi:hypothetical protein